MSDNDSSPTPSTTAVTQPDMPIEAPITKRRSPRAIPPPFTITHPTSPRRPNRHRNKYFTTELIHLFGIMLRIISIGPDEYLAWEHYLVHLDRDVDSIRRTYTVMHRKKIPTRDPNIPEEASLAKDVKHTISVKASVGGEERKI